MSEATHEEIGRAWSRMKECQGVVDSLEESVKDLMDKIPRLHARSTSVREEHGELLLITTEKEGRTGVEYVEKYPSYDELAHAVHELQRARDELEEAKSAWKEHSS